MAAAAPITPIAPWHFRLAKRLIRGGIRGPGIWLRCAYRLGLLHSVVRYDIAPGITADIPLYRWENLWDRQEVLDYERPLLDAVADRVEKQGSPVTLIDCGADIGLFPVLLLSRTRLIERIIAFEPNEAAFGLLEQNLSRLPCSAEARRQAVSHFSGHGALEHAPYDRSENAMFLVVREDGPIKVTTIDQLALPPETNLLLKIDVEGGERDVLQGALETLRRVDRFLVVLEAHPNVVRRTGIDPLENVRLITSMRACQVAGAEQPQLTLDLQRPLMPQLGERQVSNLLVQSS